MKDNTKKSCWIDEKQVIYWSEKYAKKSKAERDEFIKKAHEIIANPVDYNKDTAKGTAAYIANIRAHKPSNYVKQKT